MIESASNPLFKRIKALQTKKARERESVFVIEGKSFVDDMPEDARVKRYVVSDSFARTHDVSMYEKRAETTIISDGLFKKAADSVTPQGILAICEQPDATLDEAVKRDRLSLLCECVSDPGNLGALIRVAAAVGCGVAILAGECADLYNPKTVRAAAGAILRIPTIRVADV
jgi:TrmH family RNA methyltransferase